MQLIATKLGRAGKLDRLRFIRDDGTSAEIDIPRQGALPHDLIHYVVEQGLGWQGGFLSLVAQGADARFVMEITHDPLHHEVEVSAVQVEAMVEALQTQLWAGSFDYEAFVYGLITASEVRGIEPPAPPPAGQARRLFEHAVELNAEWQRVPPQGTFALEFAPAA